MSKKNGNPTINIGLFSDTQRFIEKLATLGEVEEQRDAKTLSVSIRPFGLFKVPTVKSPTAAVSLAPVTQSNATPSAPRLTIVK